MSFIFRFRSESLHRAIAHAFAKIEIVAWGAQLWQGGLPFCSGQPSGPPIQTDTVSGSLDVLCGGPMQVFTTEVMCHDNDILTVSIGALSTGEVVKEDLNITCNIGTAS